MKRVLCPQLPTPDRDVEVPEAEARHLVQVLRARDGDVVQALDGRGHAVMAKLQIRGGKSAWLKHEAPATAAGQSQSLPIRLELAVLKGDAMEWAVEKAVELGVTTLVPVLTAHTVVQTGKKGPEAFQERWQKIADQALKQCGRLDALRVEMPTALEQVLAHKPAVRLWCHDSGRDSVPFVGSIDLPSMGEIAILVGPEGGWSDRELPLIERSATPVSLGPLVLRAETAALFAVSAASTRLRSLDKGASTKGNGES